MNPCNTFYLYLSCHIILTRNAATSSFSANKAISTGNMALVDLGRFVFMDSNDGHLFTSVLVTCRNPSSAA